jgi:hypothetical protein
MTPKRDDVTNPLHMPFDKAVQRVIKAGPYKEKPTPKRPAKKPKKPLGRPRTNPVARQSGKPAP